MASAACIGGKWEAEVNDVDEAVRNIEAGDAWEETDEVVELEVKRPLDRVIPVRMPSGKWEELRREARELGVGPTTLARMWILERLRQSSRLEGRRDC